MSLPDWPGAGQAYTKAYAYMEKYGADPDLIEALNKGDEEYIKWANLNYNTRTLEERGDLK